MSKNIFERLLAGGIIRTEEMGEAWEVVFRAQRLSPALNASTTIEEMRQRLSELIQSDIDKTTTVFVPFHTNFGKHIKIGKNVFINHACTFLDLGGITIEDDVQIGPKVNLITENHPVAPSQRKNLDLKSIVIKRNAWIGAGATILPGVVNKDVPPDTIVGGIPARIIRRIEE